MRKFRNFEAEILMEASFEMRMRFGNGKREEGGILGFVLTMSFCACGLSDGVGSGFPVRV